MMDHRFSLSIFTIEVNGTPTVALQAKRHQDAKRFCEHDRLRTKLGTLMSHGVPLCDASASMKIRLATPSEVDLYREATQSSPPSDQFNAVYLVDIDR
jgi:hypothetical protein